MNINGTQNRIQTGSNVRRALPKTKTESVQAESSAPFEQDTVEVTTDSKPTEETQKGRKHKLSRMIRKGFLSAASTGMAALNSILSIPVGMQMGLDTLKEIEAERKAPQTGKPEQAEQKRSPEELKRLNAARISTIASSTGGSIIGMALLGPVGLVVGGVVGYLTGTTGNHLETRSGIADQKMEKMTADVKDAVGDSRGLWAKAKAILRGGASGAVQGYKTRKTTSKIQLSGMLDGVGEAVKDWKESKSEPVKPLQDDSEHGLLTKAAMTLAGGVFGTAGVMINAPGGAIIGTLESLKETKSYIPSQMEKNLMLWSTNVGKFLPAAIVSATFGVAAGTAVGVATASVTSIIDGKMGVNRKIARPVEQAVKEAHGEEEVKENLRAYYRAGKGSVVGLSAGIREGWKAGFQGGGEMFSDALATTPEAIESKE